MGGGSNGMQGNPFIPQMPQDLRQLYGQMGQDLSQQQSHMGMMGMGRSQAHANQMASMLGLQADRVLGLDPMMGQVLPQVPQKPTRPWELECKHCGTQFNDPGDSDACPKCGGEVELVVPKGVETYANKVYDNVGMPTSREKLIERAELAERLLYSPFGGLTDRPSPEGHIKMTDDQVEWFLRGKPKRRRGILSSILGWMADKLDGNGRR